MSSSFDMRVPALVVLAAVVGCQQPEPATDVYAYSLLAPDTSGATLALGRVVIGQGGASCPTLISGPESLPTVLRAAPKLGDFSGVTVCEALVDFDKTYTATVLGTPITLQGVQNESSRVLVYGDTGCHHKDCGSDAASPFDTLATAGAGLGPNLILHMGDYNYRGTGGGIKTGTVYDAGDVKAPDGDAKDCQLVETYYSQNAPDNGPADNWTDWQLDFFSAAGDLLSAAPWVFARGNHELCSRAGPGWFYFLGPGSDGLEAQGTISQYSCPDQSADTNVLSHLVFIDPYTVSLGTLRVAVLDSVNACDNYSPAATTAKYTAQFAQLSTQVSGTTPTWLMTHRPLWGLSKSQVVNQTLQAALPEDALPPAVTLSVAGHMHYFQSTAFTAGGRPPQLVVGNSGVSIWGDPTGCLSATVDNLQANVNGIEEHGFLDATVNADGTWSGDIVNYQAGSSPTPTETKVATCGTASLPNAICTLLSNPNPANDCLIPLPPPGTS